MTWIKTVLPGAEPALAQALSAVRDRLPKEYVDRSAGERLPSLVRDDSITLAHALFPEVMRGISMAYAALLDPSLPLSRRRQELIAATVSALNRCFY